MKGGREAKIQFDIETCEAVAARLATELELKKEQFDAVSASLGETKAEMSKLDRLVLTSQKQKIIKASDMRQMRTYTAAFDDLDKNRLKLEQDLRDLATGAVEARKAAAENKAAVERLRDKLERVAAAKAVRLPEATGAKRNSKIAAMGLAATR